MTNKKNGVYVEMVILRKIVADYQKQLTERDSPEIRDSLAYYENQLKEKEAEFRKLTSFD